MGNSNSSGLKSEEEKIRVKQEECDDGTPDDATSDLQVSIDLEMIYKFYSLGFVKVEEDGDDGETGSSRIIHWPVVSVNKQLLMSLHDDVTYDKINY